MSSFRTLFPFFSHSKEVYLDTAATSQRLDSAICAMHDYYHRYNANVHRGSYASARLASNQYEQARASLARFLGAPSASNIVFTSGATDAINIVANGLLIDHLSGNEIVVCESEHHANLLPWQQFANKHQLKLTRLTLGANGIFDDKALSRALAMLTPNVAVFAMAHVSNALGNIYPVEALCEKAQAVGALSIIDGTQAAAHIAIDVKAINCDFYAISGHKMYASTGIGVLYGKYDCLETLSPSKLGGEMIKAVTWDSFSLQPPPAKFEAGTPNIAGALSMAAASEFLQQNMHEIQIHEKYLVDYLLNKLTKLINTKQLIVLGNMANSSLATSQAFKWQDSAIPLLAFTVNGIHANDIAMQLATDNIATRAGHHCAMPLMHSLSIPGCVRVSIGCYTSIDDIDAMVDSLYRICEQSLVALIDTKKPALMTIEDELIAATNWNTKHRLLLLHSKNLPTLPESMRSDTNEVGGCEAKVWLSVFTQSNGQRRLLAYSESKVIRGILAVILDKLNGIDTKSAKQFDINQFLHHLGLSHYFSDGRRDGIANIIHHIDVLLNQG